jgi:Pterin 4 alpha carbinolamine dehydratase
MVFVNEVAAAAEVPGHHPDIDIRWNKVTLALSSHAEAGLTDRDLQPAAPHPGARPSYPARLTDQRATGAGRVRCHSCRPRAALFLPGFPGSSVTRFRCRP